MKLIFYIQINTKITYKLYDTIIFDGDGQSFPKFSK